VKVYPGRPYTLYVTDYSQNTSVYKYTYFQHRDEWPGPFGKLTLQIGCWEGTEHQAQKCRVGEIYHFRNVNGRLFRPLFRYYSYELEIKMETSKGI